MDSCNANFNISLCMRKIRNRTRVGSFLYFLNGFIMLMGNHAWAVWKPFNPQRENYVVEFSNPGDLSLVCGFQLMHVKKEYALIET